MSRSKSSKINQKKNRAAEKSHLGAKELEAKEPC